MNFCVIMSIELNWSTNESFFCAGNDNEMAVAEQRLNDDGGCETWIVNIRLWKSVVFIAPPRWRHATNAISMETIVNEKIKLKSTFRRIIITILFYFSSFWMNFLNDLCERFTAHFVLLSFFLLSFFGTFFYLRKRIIFYRQTNGIQQL